jgi:hypothetical protein
MNITIRFHGRQLGALGITYGHELKFNNIPNDATAREISEWVRVTAYDGHEHISTLRWRDDDARNVDFWNFC